MILMRTGALEAAVEMSKLSAKGGVCPGRGRRGVKASSINSLARVSFLVFRLSFSLPPFSHFSSNEPKPVQRSGKKKKKTEKRKKEKGRAEKRNYLLLPLLLFPVSAT